MRYSMVKTALWGLLAVILASCGGGVPRASGTPWSITNPPQPNPSIQDAATFNVVQSDAVTPASNVPIFVNRENCSVNCDTVLTTNTQGVATMSMTAYAGYCLSLHNANASPATVPTTPSYVTGYGPQAYLTSDECVTMGDTATTFNLAE